MKWEGDSDVSLSDEQFVDSIGMGMVETILIMNINAQF